MRTNGPGKPKGKAKKTVAKAPRSWASELGGAVRTRRKALTLTQLELSDLANVGPAFLYELEHGKLTLRMDKVVDVLRVLGLELVVREGRAALSIDPAIRDDPA